ncbi:aquaporin AQPAe.a-like [Hylaeus anthracinus]|uniref:aquaporin AQPAe.a-like n=1 Tax=Hylaeus anthracinus TaxID=313031 RepID=UPI0023B93615|nr:aquaporin AQPAe.a-like [Hylaeus anthracinus]
MEDESSKSIWYLQKGTTTMFLAEVVGTAVLLFIGCMGSVGTMGLSIPLPLQTSIAFGMTVNMLIMMVGHISGAHFNPAVTIGAVIVGLKTIPTGIVYVVGQFIGAIIGYGLLVTVTPPELLSDGHNSSAGFCVTAVYSGVSIVQAILIEALCTAIVLCTACATWDPRCAHTADSTAIRFGFSIVGLSLAASPYTGCSMNPARSFAPALFQGDWKDQWIYWIGPTVGALLGTYTYQLLFLEKETVMTADDHSFIQMNSRNSDSINIPCDKIRNERLEVTKM